MRITSHKIGSRQDNTTIYWTSRSDIHVVCGCFRGDIESFKHKVAETHKNNIKYLDQYNKFIELAEYVINFKY